MNFSITQPAAKWYAREMDLEEGDAVRFFARLGGHSTVQTGFSLGISNEQPVDPAFTTKEQGVTFFVEEKDAWYFDGVDFHIKYNKKDDEIRYEFEEK